MDVWIDRPELAQLIAARVAERPVVVLTGIRQVGKSALLRHLFPTHRYLTLDLPSLAEAAERDPEQLLREHPTPLLIDEVQYAPALFRHLKRSVDADRTPGRFVLSGSQKFVLMREVSESLAGRASVIEIEGLRGVEALAAQPQFDECDLLLRHGFPELIANPRLDAAAWLRDYTVTYLERDLRAILNVSSLRDFERFLRLLALRGGGLLNQSELARDVGIAVSTVGQWLSALTTAGLVVLLEPWFSNRAKRLVKSPKVYFTEVSLQASLCGIATREELLRSPLLGALWETFVFGELRRAQQQQQGSSRIFFYRDNAREADFLIDRGGRISLFDAKWNEQPDRAAARALEGVIDRVGADVVDHAALLCRAANRYPISERVVAQPWRLQPQ